MMGPGECSVALYATVVLWPDLGALSVHLTTGTGASNTQWIYRPVEFFRPITTK